MKKIGFKLLNGILDVIAFLLVLPIIVLERAHRQAAKMRNIIKSNNAA